jgi:hypothetical protein
VEDPWAWYHNINDNDEDDDDEEIEEESKRRHCFFLLSFWCLMPKGEKKFSSIYLVSLAYALLFSQIVV